MKRTYKILAILTFLQSVIPITLILFRYLFDVDDDVIYLRFKEQASLLIMLPLVPALIFSIWTLSKKSTSDMDESSQLERDNNILEKRIKKKELEQKLDALGKADED